MVQRCCLLPFCKANQLSCNLLLTKIMEASPINQYLRDFETKNNIRFLFVCESGSRAHGTSSTFSDHDLKGVYMPSGKGQPIVFRGTNTSSKGVKNKIDIEFIPIKKFLEEITKDDCTYLRWVTSPCTYINGVQGLQQTIEQNFNFPVLEVSDRIKKDLDKAKKQGKRQAKKLLNMIVDTLLILNFKLTTQFPPLPINSLLNYLSTRPDVFPHMPILKELLEQIMILKKNGKGLNQIDVPNQIIELSQRTLALPINFPLKTQKQMTTAIKELEKKIK